jgi:GT2 family glycosyltransferase
MARTAILILNYNGEQHLKRFLPSIIANSPGCDIIVGDNNSTDGSIQLLESDFPGVLVIKLDQNYGYAGGYNQLIKQIDHEFVALVNSDVEVSGNWTEDLVSTLQADDKIAAIQPKILSYSERHKFEYAGAAGGFIDVYGYPFCRGRIFNTIEDDHGQYDDNREIFWASGACFMLKRKIFMELGGFDADFFAHMEEIDLCWRMHHSGYKVIYNSKSVVYHLGGGTLNYNNPKKTYLNFRNSWVMLMKNLPAGNRRFILLKRWCLDIVSILFFAFRLQFNNALAVIHAHIYILSNLSPITRKRLPVFDEVNTNVSNKPVGFSLVWQYYFKGKKTFAALIPD